MAAAEVLRKSTKHIVNIFEDVHRFFAVVFDSIPPPLSWYVVCTFFVYSVPLYCLSPSLSFLCIA
jgi:hypothetical protein